MSEYQLGLLVSSKIIWLALFAFLYQRGGQSKKYFRRYMGSAWMMIGIVLYSLIQGVFSYWYLF